MKKLEGIPVAVLFGDGDIADYRRFPACGFPGR
jgi:hypothetical protein